MARPRVFVSSWLFAPYPGSADLDLFKRLQYCDLDFDVVQARRSGADLRLFEGAGPARFDRTELDLHGLGPRTRGAREAFASGVLKTFSAAATSYDALLSHSNEVPSHEAALRLKTANPSLPWVAYFGDLVSKNPYVPHLGEYPLFEEDCLTEARTLERANLIICNNEHQRALMLASAGSGVAGRTVVIPHAFDARFYPPHTTPNARFRFTHLGTLYPVKRRAMPLLQAVELLLEVYPELAQRFEVVFVGDDVPSEDLAYWRRMRQQSHVRFEPAVSYLESLALMQASDALVVIDGLFDELKFNPFFPGKLADYFGSGQPVLAVTMKEGPTAELLRARGELISDEDPERLAYVLKRYLEGRVPRHAPPARFRSQVVSAQMEAAIRAAIDGPEAIAALPAKLEALGGAA